MEATQALETSIGLEDLVVETAGTFGMPVTLVQSLPA